VKTFSVIFIPIAGQLCALIVQSTPAGRHLAAALRILRCYMKEGYLQDQQYRSIVMALSPFKSSQLRDD
jgi:hypothetical protein